MKRPWTLDEIERLKALAEDGKTVSYIAYWLERSYDSVLGAARRHGVQVHRFGAVNIIKGDTPCL